MKRLYTFETNPDDSREAFYKESPFESGCNGKPILKFNRYKPRPISHQVVNVLRLMYAVEDSYIPHMKNQLKTTSNSRNNIV